MTSSRLSWLAALIIALVCQMMWAKSILLPPGQDVTPCGEVTAATG
ncbi:MAG: hypothetical protein IPK79_05015 [Vampirovibrionales bacterium]|nr:hypothetical protein [Vampirovibrionales bacterium]